ncbi:MAG: deoxyribonuclease IV [Thermoguttaceae bacterium]
MVLLGAHMSIAGGYHKAVERAVSAGCQCVQVFTRNSNQWKAKDITQQEATRFRTAVGDSRLACTVAHDSYLINLASPDDALWRRSVDSLVEELRRAELLGIPLVVTHPGAHTSGSEKDGLRRIVRGLNQLHSRTGRLQARCVLETTAGQGTQLGWRFEHLAAILESVKAPERLGFCFDTCHVFAAGYPLQTLPDYLQTMRQFDRLVGLDRICVLHVNDSRKEQGSRVDRHTHIGQGKMGLEPFRHLLNDSRFGQVPMILETPKGSGEELDRANLRTLRSLVESSAGCSR